MSAITNVIVVGAGGSLGPTLIDALLASKKFIVAAFVRPESKSVFPREVKIVKADYSRQELEAALKGQDAVISTVGIGGFAAQKTVINAAIASGVKHFFPSDFGADITEQTIAFFPVFRDKQDAIDYLISREGAISWTVIKTSAFFDWGMKVGFTGFDLVNRTANLIDGGVTKFHATNLSTLTGVVVAILSVPEIYEKTKNQIISISNHEVSQHDILATVERITGVNWEVTYTDSDDLIEDAKGTSADAYAMIRAGLFGKIGLGRLSGKLWNDELGLTQKSLEEDLELILEGKSP
ncbi:hypothetical protein DL96DRAFT_1684602 [Flagelloscypha sp. PMI_526]|nr:hypothetical protein DL96DRAFT_1684602 [Flagelloscypha sp. PMI_526]